MLPALLSLTFAAATLAYAVALALFYSHVARSEAPHRDPAPDRAAHLLALAVFLHAAYVTLSSLVAHTCPVRSAHFMFSLLSVFASVVFLLLRKRQPIDAAGILVAPIGLLFLLGTFVLGVPEPATNPTALFVAAHVLSNMLGLGLFLLAGILSALYIVHERRLKTKQHLVGRTVLPPLDTLDRMSHRLLLAGFPLLTLGVLTGAAWAHHLERGDTEFWVRALFSYATWATFLAVLLLRALAGWRGRRAALGTLLGLVLALVVIAAYALKSGGVG